jgi:FemAB-related protein (PEP-CTERM system-associated)
MPPDSNARLAVDHGADEALLRVERLDDASCPRWDAFVQACPTATFFHLSGWTRTVERVLGHPSHCLYVQDASGVIQGVLPMSHVRSRLFGNSLVSVAFAVYGGIAAATAQAAAALDAAARALAEELAVDWLELRHVHARESDAAVNALYVTFRKSIPGDAEANLKAIPRKQRAMVRKGIDAGLTARIDADVDTFFAMYSESVRNLGTPVLPKRWYAALMQTFGAQCEVLSVMHEGTPISSVLSFYFRDEVLPFYGGGGAQARALKANDFMYYALMNHAAARGAKVFDYGRSKDGAGSYAFKKNWGFEPAPLHYEVHLVRATDPPALNPNNPKFKLAIATWQRLPLPITHLIGPMVAKYLA